MAGWYIGDHVHMCPEHSFPYKGSAGSLPGDG